MTGDPSGTAAPGGRLGVFQGMALCVGAVLGTGVIALPALAAEAAGPASLLAWLALVLLSAPLAGAFAALGARYPDGGGVSTYARLAFGERAAAVVGWCFYFAVPPGATAATLFFGDYVSAASKDGGGFPAWAAALALMLVAIAANAVGLRLTGRLQLVLAVLLAGLVLASVLLSLPDVRWAHLQPFAPHGWAAIGSAATLLVWSFAGWEAISQLAGEFRRPARDLPRATAGAVLVVGALYLSVAFAVVAVLGAGAADSAAPLGELMARGLGGPAQPLAALAALLLTFGVLNTYLASAAQLGAALARDGALPAALSRGGGAGRVPRRSLAVVAGLSLGSLAVALGAGFGPRPLVLLTTGMFVTVYAVGVAAALRLLPRGGAGWWAALVSLVAVLALLLMSGRYLLWPVAVAAAALGYLRLTGRRPGRRAVPAVRAPAPGGRSPGERAPEVDRELA